MNFIFSWQDPFIYSSCHKMRHVWEDLYERFCDVG